MARYLVMVMRTPQFQLSAVEPHQAFLETLRKKGQLEMAGPFTDKTGGAYLMVAETPMATQSAPLMASQTAPPPRTVN
jgi:uncharacterized protein YciI